MNLNSHAFSSLTVLSFLLGRIAYAETKLTFNDRGGITQCVILIKGDKVRMSNREGDYYLYDDTKRVLFFADISDEIFVKINLDVIRKRNTTRTKMRLQSKEDLKKQIPLLPEDRRRALEEHIDEYIAHNTAVWDALLAKLRMWKPNMRQEKTEIKETIQGMNCKISKLVSLDDKQLGDVCIADASVMDPTDFKTLVKMFEFLDRNLLESVVQELLTGFSPLYSGYSSWLHSDGLVLRFRNGTQDPLVELSGLTKEALFEIDFRVPKNFRKVEPAITFHADND